MNYICSLYSNGVGDLTEVERSNIIQQRVNYTMRKVYELLVSGEYPYSPILHCHELSNRFELPKECHFWKDIDRNAIKHCSKVIVLKMEDIYGNWIDSTGIQDEISYAKSIGKVIEYIECDDYKIRGEQ